MNHWNHEISLTERMNRCYTFLTVNNKITASLHAYAAYLCICNSNRQVLYVFIALFRINTLSIPEAGEMAETPVKRYCNTGKVPIRTQKRPYLVRNYYFLLGYIHAFDKGNSAFGGK